MRTNFPLKESSINDIYMSGDSVITYQIPIYQRNYAWQEDEITALVKDIYDALKKDKNTPYYIGTLVTYKRNAHMFEVIDGQQRLTTIYILLKALDIKNITNRLTYTSRKLSAETIESMPEFGNAYDNGIKDGYDYALKAINDNIPDEAKTDFIHYFLQKVHIVHYEVPKDVDLNHYFEVMNSRGEQLEMHEIVKSILGQNLESEKELSTFCRVWEACSEMNVYIQQLFPEESVFGNDLTDFKVSNFNDIPQSNPSDGKKSILEIMSGDIAVEKKNVDIQTSDKFQPIIDFPNFLLLVLKYTLWNGGYSHYQTIILDDKELLKSFERILKIVKDKSSFAKIFASNLLKARYLLDNYIVHHSIVDTEKADDTPWSLQTLYKETSNKKYPRNLCPISEQDKQLELVQLLSMFEVSFTPKQRKNYLFYCLCWLFDNRNTDDYLEFLRQLARKYFCDVYLNTESLNERNLPKPNAFDSVILEDKSLNTTVDQHKDYQCMFESIYKQGRADISLFVFNYTDYVIWRKYADEIRGNKTKTESEERRTFFSALGCTDFGLDPFRTFYFSRTRKSLEHYYPQAKAVNHNTVDTNAISENEINCFGNFAMIGAQANSSGSNWDPVTKLDHYLDRKSDAVSVASLKFRIMLEICRTNHIEMLNGNSNRKPGFEWNYSDMISHQQKMLQLICKNHP